MILFILDKEIISESMFTSRVSILTEYSILDFKRSLARTMLIQIKNSNPSQLFLIRHQDLQWKRERSNWEKIQVPTLLKFY